MLGIKCSKAFPLLVMEHQSPQSAYLPQHDSPPLSHQTITPEPIPHDLQAPTETLTPRRLTKKAIRIAQSKALSPDADEPTSLSRNDRHGEAFPTVSSLDAGQDRENIAKTSAMSHESSPRVPSFNADEGIYRGQRKKTRRAYSRGCSNHMGIIDIGEELGADKSTEKRSNDTEEMVNVLSSMKAANILSSGGAAFSTASVSPADVFPTAGVPTFSGSFPTPMRIPIISAKDKGKEKVTKTEVPKKKKLQEQIDAQLMIEGLDRSNEVIAKHLSEYKQAEVDLSVGEKIELISELVKYQDYLDEILKYQAQQSKPSLKKEQRKFYMSEESEKVKRPGIKLDQGSSKRVKISYISRSEPSQEQQFKGSKGVSEEELKGMMQLVPLDEVYIEALQQFDRDDLHQLWILVTKTFSIKQSTRDKEKGLWVELKRMFEPDFEDQLWTYHQAFMHDSLDWNLYDTCGVHHMSTKKNQEIFIFIILRTVQDEELFEASSPVHMSSTAELPSLSTAV
nr:hypothetical protein [Tanacetum cinerariifolium]